MHKYVVDMNLPTFEQTSRVDDWWSSVKKAGIYPGLCRLALAALSVFHGPQIESSFNTMGDILHVKSSNTSVETYGSYQSVKFHLRTVGKSAIEVFRRKDIKYDNVNPALCKNMQGSSRAYRTVLETKRRAAEEKTRRVQVKTSVLSKKDSNAKLANKCAKSRREFYKHRMRQLLGSKSAKSKSE